MGAWVGGRRVWLLKGVMLGSDGSMRWQAVGSMRVPLCPVMRLWREGVVRRERPTVVSSSCSTVVTTTSQLTQPSWRHHLDIEKKM